MYHYIKKYKKVFVNRVGLRISTSDPLYWPSNQIYIIHRMPAGGIHKMKAYTRKRQQGGKTYDYPYMYLMLPYSIVANAPTLISYMNSKVTACHCVSMHATISCDSVSTLSMNAESILILIMRYNWITLYHADSTNTILNTKDFQNNIFAHCVIEPKKGPSGHNIISIFDICLHDRSKKGRGSIIINTILTALEFSYRNIPNVILWLGVKIEHAEFEKVSFLYISFGFGGPFITDMDPFGNHYPFYFLSLSKRLDSYVSITSTTTLTYHKALDMKYQLFKLLENPMYASEIYFTLDKSAILHLRLFPYLSKESGVTPLTQSQLMREFSGNLHIVSSSIKDKTIVYTMTNETIGMNQGIQFVVGEYESVPTPSSSYTFHTHPISLYKKYNVLIGTPSGQDCGMFLWNALGDKKNAIPLTDIAKCHFVISVEGIYSIELSTFAILNITLLGGLLSQTSHDKFLTNMGNLYEYPFPKRYFDWKSMEVFDSTPGSDMKVANAVKVYIDWINAVRLPGIANPLLTVQFHAWRNIHKDYIFHIRYATSFLNSFPESSNIRPLMDEFPYAETLDHKSRNASSITKTLKGKKAAKKNVKA